MEKRRSGNEGMTLVEAMVSSVVLAVGILGLMSAVTSSATLDQVTQENNIAIDAARLVVEQLNSEGFEALASRIDPFAGGEGAAGSDNYPEYYPDEQYFCSYDKGWGQWYPDSYGDDYEAPSSIIIKPVMDGDVRGQFNIVTYKDNNQCYRLLDPVPGENYVGTIELANAIHPETGAAMTDVIEITIRMQWWGKKGPVRKVLRRQLGNW